MYTVVINCRDPATIGRWWAEVLDWQVIFGKPDEVVIAKDDDAYAMS